VKEEVVDRSGISVVVGALILAVALVVSAQAVSSAIADNSSELEELRLAVAESGVELAKAVKAAPAAARPSPARRGPDPAKEYAVNVKGAPSRGPESAKITVVEFSDFQCPFCSRVNPTLARLRQEYGDDLRIVFKHLPLSIHPKAPAAHAASVAAHRQGQFWEMHDKMFDGQRLQSEAQYVAWAEELGLDVARFKKDMASAEVKAEVDADLKEAEDLEVGGTPAFFINGRFLSGAQPYPNFKKLVDEILES
jgi:protein-disulfide isomerase